uniref:Centrosomal protein CEP104 N-terminal domain-containing protein n=1 Tax=Parascaris univalens TaxID=6257 RepID=A0A915ANI6_PARUN
MLAECLGSGSTLNEISWRPIVVGKEDPKRFAQQINSDNGWISDQNPSYRFDIVLALTQPTNVHRIKIDAMSERIPSKIEFRIGIDDKQIDEPNYESSKNVRS